MTWIDYAAIVAGVAIVAWVIWYARVQRRWDRLGRAMSIQDPEARHKAIMEACGEKPRRA
jgi:hypothetical protein